MWFMAVYSKASLLLWRGGSNPSREEEGPSLQSGSSRSRQLRNGMGYVLHRFTTPMDPWRMDSFATRRFERMSAVGRNDPEPRASWSTGLLLPLLGRHCPTGTRIQEVQRNGAGQPEDNFHFFKKGETARVAPNFRSQCLANCSDADQQVVSNPGRKQ